ncbi:MAG: Hsp20/alpha crystallin family protein [Gammaproteobacteria bacterium]|jgi:HSP20 family protein|nr:Hsp20/alpha crystallin family protein [Gammaproteobacteria bacterium]MBP6052267.1 Hsp20/alpha crystallin family protein [Pseudomonadales bacterium]MBK6581720.1 Hsp20/alpha crystallin family protein [Gammaproteobacteria bacterium]MBK7170090.1 Hsp20/alpha crystallin family protein [Gammaproteobacteria bacterium]MBK7520554.1 Hsp20/alpha crystallin family protein [Gammaproteobacteria bacterium]
MALKAKKKAGTRGKTPAPAGKKSTSVSRALTPFEEMDVLFDRLSRGLMSRMGFPALGEAGWPFQAHAPKVDVIDRGKDLLVRAEIPGISKEDLSISLGDQTVTIRGETRKETKEEKGDYFRREISSGSFQRTLALPSAVAGDQAKASFNNGVLELVLPKIENAGARKLNID